MDLQGSMQAVGGGILVGTASALRLAFQGRAEGVSGIAAGILHGPSALRSERALFLCGMALAGAGLHASNAASFGGDGERPLAVLLAAGLLVGLGARLASGCTSGHGVLGVARGSRRSIAAILLFSMSAVVTVWLSGLWGRA